MLQSIYQNMQIAEQNKKNRKSTKFTRFQNWLFNQSLIGIQTINGVDKYFGAGNRFNVVNIGVAIPLTVRATKPVLKV